MEDKKVYRVTPFTDSDFATISEAIEKVPEGSTIYITSGRYEETLNINKKLVIYGNDENLPMICSPKETVCNITAEAELYNLSFSNSNDISNETLDEPQSSDNNPENLRKDPKELYGIVEIYAAAKLCRCTIGYSNSLGVYIEESNAMLQECQIYNCHYVALGIDNCDPFISNCKIEKNYGNAQVRITKNSNPIFEKTLIHYGCKKCAGVTIDKTSKGIFTNCEISYNYIGIATFDSAKPIFKDCSIVLNHLFGGRSFDNSVIQFIRCNTSMQNFIGLEALDKSQLYLNQCELFGNEKMNVNCDKEAKIDYFDCKIH